jgi:hypothetical protein
LLIIKKSKIGGKGVYTLDSIKKGKKVFKFADRVIPIKHRSGCDCKICCRCINLKKDLWLYPTKNSLGWNLNHSCNSNSYSKRKFIYTLKNIKAGDEITIDYSTTNIDKKWKMICHCKSKNCRKIIRSIQYLPKKLFKKYKNKMQPFIKDNYVFAK